MRKTKIVNQATNPIWNQGFPFQEVAGEYLKIKCYNSDSFGDENMGSARVNLQAIEDGTVQDVWVPLEKTQQGEIRLKIEVLGSELELDTYDEVHIFLSSALPCAPPPPHHTRMLVGHAKDRTIEA